MMKKPSSNTFLKIEYGKSYIAELLSACVHHQRLTDLQSKWERERERERELSREKYRKIEHWY